MSDTERKFFEAHRVALERARAAWAKELEGGSRITGTEWIAFDSGFSYGLIERATLLERIAALESELSVARAGLPRAP